MPKGVYKRKKLSKKELKLRKQIRAKKALDSFKSFGVDEIRRYPTKGRDSYIADFSGDFNLNIDVRVGPRLAEESHSFSWRYWHND